MEEMGVLGDVPGGVREHETATHPKG